MTKKGKWAGRLKIAVREKCAKSLKGRLFFGVGCTGVRIPHWFMGR